nr:hypothetical protein Iba_chr03cCG9950 [Ipomoea batatas]
MFLLVPPSNARTGKNANIDPLMSTRKFSGLVSTTIPRTESPAQGTYFFCELSTQYLFGFVYLKIPAFMTDTVSQSCKQTKKNFMVWLASEERSNITSPGTTGWSMKLERVFGCLASIFILHQKNDKP